MKKIYRTLVLSCLLGSLLFSQNSFGKAGPEHSQVLELQKFDLAGGLVAQYTGIRFAGMMATWTPQYRLTEEIALRGNLGLGFLGGSGIGFLVIDAAVSGSYMFAVKYFGEVGLGIQLWASNGGALFSIPLKVGYLFDENELFSGVKIERAYLGYTIIPSVSAHEFWLGAGFAF